MRLFPRSDNLGRLSLAVPLVLGALSLAALSQQFGDEDASGAPEEGVAWSSVETEREFEIKEEPAGEIDIGTLLALYKEYYQPTQLEEEEDDEGEAEEDSEEDDGEEQIDDYDGSRFSLFGVVGRIRAKMRHGKNFPRSILFDCPSEPARHDPSRRSKMLFYNPANRRTFRIEETRDGGWPSGGIDSFKRAGFDVSKPTLAIMGGYMQTGLSEWVLLFKRRLAEMSGPGASGGAPFNLLIYDWAAYSLDFYEQSVSFVPHMGSVLAKFFETLIDHHGYNVSQVQLVSFSLSTHITGLAGRRLKSKYGEPIPVIHALDPTGVCFHDKYASSRFADQYGLRPSDAKLVVARHYNMKQLGAGRFIGGVDIVVNNGMSQPVMYPARFRVSDVLAGAGIYIASHMRAVEHETTLVPDYNNDCHEIAYECSSHEAFNAGECGHCRAHNQSCVHISTLGNFGMGQRPAEMDFKPGTAMYVTTGRSKYCEHTFQVVVRLDEPSVETLGEFIRGQFRVRLGEVEINPSHQVSGNGKTLFTQLVRPDRLPAPFPTNVRVGNSVRPLLKSIKYIALTHMSHILREVRRSHSIKYCPDDLSEGTLIKCK